MKKITWSSFKEFFGRDQAEPGDRMIINDTLYAVSAVDPEGVCFQVINDEGDVVED